MSLLGGIYGAAVGARNRLYDRGILRSRKLAGPVISVGSLSAGGAGKTPFVILLGELLKARGVSFDVLSRGYGRATRGVRVVDPSGSPGEFGDEPLLIARRLGCPVIVGESRYEAGLLAEEKFGPQLHILDDGFQHRSLARDLDMVLLTAEDVKDKLLPTGRLREPLKSLTRAHVIVGSGDFNASVLPAAKPVWRIRRDVQIPEPPARPIVFCGIARPGRFLEQLRLKGISPIGHRFYRDHHAYSDRDIDELLRLRAENNADGFITTEKDEVNLGSCLSRLSPIAVARVTIDMVDPADAVDTIFRVVHNREP